MTSKPTATVAQTFFFGFGGDTATSASPGPFSRWRSCSDFRRASRMNDTLQLPLTGPTIVGEPVAFSIVSSTICVCTPATPSIASRC